MGTRLRTVEPSLPKPLLPIGGRPILAWSIEALLGRGIRRVLVVVGHQSAAIRRAALAWPRVELIENPDYATTGSMASLASALPAVAEDFLLLEGDVLYEPVALDRLLARPEPNVLLASGPTGAGDEVWVDARHGRLVALSKERRELGAVVGELVGLTRVSVELADAMQAAYESFRRARGHGRMSYETDALVACAASHPIAVELVPDLLWGEVDDESHHRRVERLWPALAPRLRARGS